MWKHNFSRRLSANWHAPIFRTCSGKGVRACVISSRDFDVTSLLRKINQMEQRKEESCNSPAHVEMEVY